MRIVVSLLLFVVSLLLFVVAPIHGQSIEFQSGSGIWAQNDGAAVGRFSTLNLDPSTLTGTLSGSTLDLGLAGLDASQIANACATNANCSAITGNWTFSTGVPVLQAGGVIGSNAAGPFWLKFDGNGSVDPWVGWYATATTNGLYFNRRISVANCTDNAVPCTGSATTTGIDFYSSTTLTGYIDYGIISAAFNLVSGSTTTAAIASYLKTNLTSTSMGTTSATPNCTVGQATCTFSNAIPAGCMLEFLTSRSLIADAGCTTYSLGDGTTATLWANATAKTVGTTTKANGGGTAAATSPAYYAAAQNVVLTCNGGTFSTGGAVMRLGIHCLNASAPAG